MNQRYDQRYDPRYEDQDRDRYQTRGPRDEEYGSRPERYPLDPQRSQRQYMQYDRDRDSGRETSDWQHHRHQGGDPWQDRSREPPRQGQPQEDYGRYASPYGYPFGQYGRPRSGADAGGSVWDQSGQRDWRRLDQDPSRRDAELHSAFDSDQAYGRSAGFSGYGRGDRIPGQTISSMQLGQEASPELPWTGRWASSSSYRGRGPKGYERTDDRLREMVCERLTEDPRIDASDVSVEVKDKIVTLTGTVRDRSTKYHIEEAVEETGGIADVHNQLRVVRDRGTEIGQQGFVAGSERSATTAGTDATTHQRGSRH